MTDKAPLGAAEYDVVIVGGGLVGASLACALSGHDLRIAVVEALPPRSQNQPSYDDRTLALALASVNIFSMLDVWPDLSENATAIRQVHVSSAGQLGMLRLSADELGVPALGYVAQAREVGGALYRSLERLPDCELICPATVRNLHDGVSHTEVEIETDSGVRKLPSKLVVAADGAQSVVRDLRDISFDVHDYGQSAIIANITPQDFHNNRAFERFTPTGQLAMLPHEGRRCGLVWVLPEDQAESWLECSDDEFLAEVQNRFGYRLGHLGKLGKRASYPLRMGQPAADTAYRTVLVGNAAHTIHPVAAQGFNLGLRDVALLAERLIGARRLGLDLGDSEIAAAYSASRRVDQQSMMTLTDGLVRVFTHPSGLVRAGRSIGLLGMSLSRSARRSIARRTMGFAGQVPALARRQQL